MAVQHEATDSLVVSSFQRYRGLDGASVLRHHVPRPEEHRLLHGRLDLLHLPKAFFVFRRGGVQQSGVGVRAAAVTVYGIYACVYLDTSVQLCSTCSGPFCNAGLYAPASNTGTIVAANRHYILRTLPHWLILSAQSDSPRHYQHRGQPAVRTQPARSRGYCRYT